MTRCSVNANGLKGDDMTNWNEETCVIKLVIYIV